MHGRQDPHNSLPARELVSLYQTSAAQHGAALVTRPRLRVIVDDAVRYHKLTLVAAPAGSGKTSLVSTLTQSDLPTAWVALDKSDDDLPIFVALLAAALRHRLQDEGQAILSFLQTVPGVHEKTAHLATILINNLSPASNSPFISRRTFRSFYCKHPFCRNLPRPTVRP